MRVRALAPRGSTDQTRRTSTTTSAFPVGRPAATTCTDLAQAPAPGWSKARREVRHRWAAVAARGVLCTPRMNVLAQTMSRWVVRLLLAGAAAGAVAAWRRSKRRRRPVRVEPRPLPEVADVPWGPEAP